MRSACCVRVSSCSRSPLRPQDEGGLSLIHDHGNEGLSRRRQYMGGSSTVCSSQDGCRYYHVRAYKFVMDVFKSLGRMIAAKRRTNPDQCVRAPRAETWTRASVTAFRAATSCVHETVRLLLRHAVTIAQRGQPHLQPPVPAVSWNRYVRSAMVPVRSRWCVCTHAQLTGMLVAGVMGFN